MPFFAVRMVNGSAWDASLGRREQAGWDAHADFMDGLVEDGFVVLGGPIGDGEEILLAIEATDEAEIRERFRGDPWTPTDQLRIGEIRPWTVWLDGRRRP